jgi:hypothetical protein
MNRGTKGGGLLDRLHKTYNTMHRGYKRGGLLDRLHKTYNTMHRGYKTGGLLNTLHKTYNTMNRESLCIVLYVLCNLSNNPPVVTSIHCIVCFM